MTKRKSISKKNRFEVLKRDKFTCKWCGKSPVLGDDVVLEIDHVVPVSKGGDNHILNLVTSCFSCNRGKGANKIDDNMVMAQEKKQMDLLQEKEEQRKEIFRWHKELKASDAKHNEDVFQYINDKITPYSLNPKGESGITKLTKKYKLNDILKAVDMSADTYLRFDKDNELVVESGADFIKKIGGILHNMNQPIVQRKASYIKGICKNRFNYFDVRVGSIILNDYIKALKDYGYSDEQIAADLDNEVMPKAKEAKNWTEWRNLLEGWTRNIVEDWMAKKESA